MLHVHVCACVKPVQLIRYFLKRFVHILTSPLGGHYICMYVVHVMCIGQFSTCLNPHF